MPPRYAYWTILIDNRPTAFRAREQADLLPTLHQLKRTNPNAEMKWFARGKLWDTPEQAQWARTNLPKPAERRGRDWRPGGVHKDPRTARPNRGAISTRTPKEQRTQSRPGRPAMKRRADADKRNRRKRG